MSIAPVTPPPHDRSAPAAPPDDDLTRPQPPVDDLTRPQPPIGDTGPVPITEERPVPPPPEPSSPPLEPASLPPEPASPPLEPVPTQADDAVPVTEQEPQRKPGRAGRNLTAAIGVGLSLGAVILLSLLIYRPAFLLVLTAAVLIGLVELTHALRAGGYRPPLVPVVVGALAMVALAWTRGPDGLVVAFLFTVLAVLLWRLADGPVGYLMDATAGVLVSLYVPLLAGFAVLMLVPDDGVARILLFMGTVVCSDVGGYAAGVLFGKHPMAPHISPKKSWEGMGGSVVACMALAVPVLAFTFHAPFWTGFLFGPAIAVSATIGDLGESLIKRDLGIKDMGHLLPGHGGLMDRLDSLLPSAAVAYLLLTLFAPA